MANYFNISEFCITDKPIPQHIADAILIHHIIPMNKVREIYGAPIFVSQRSGWRPYEHEISRGRPGTSQHTFKFTWPKGLGAADYTVKVKSDLLQLVDLLKEHTNYTRIGYYPFHNFIHCDYKDIGQGKRGYWEADGSKNWKFKEHF